MASENAPKSQESSNLGIEKERLFNLLLEQWKSDQKLHDKKISFLNFLSVSKVEDVLYEEFGLTRNISESSDNYINKQAFQFRKKIREFSSGKRSRFDVVLSQNKVGNYVNFILVLLEHLLHIAND